MLYRLAHAFNVWYPLTVAWVYIGAFALGLCLLFIFPQVTLLLLFCGLATLGFAVMLGWMIDGLARGLARHALVAGRCPRCAASGHFRSDPQSPWICAACGIEFAPDGAQVDPRDRQRWVTTEAGD
jgi:hypothetical protein